MIFDFDERSTILIYSSAKNRKHTFAFQGRMFLLTPNSTVFIHKNITRVLLRPILVAVSSSPRTTFLQHFCNRPFRRTTMSNGTGSNNSSNSSKDVWILRHGQATHNPRAEQASHEGCSHETFLKLMKEDDSLDPPLTKIGKQQAQSVHDKYGHHYHNTIELVVSSPLSRAISTADLALPPSRQSNRICCEHFREINGWFLNARRRSLSELNELFPHWNFEHLQHPEDVHWTEHEIEESQKCGERGFQGFKWLLERPEKNILLVAHGAILRYTMNDHPKVLIQDQRQQEGSSTDQRRDPGERFRNCELRRFQLSQHRTSDNTDAIMLTEIDIHSSEKYP